MSTVVPCCPELKDDCPCDVLDSHYRLTHNTTVRIGQERRIVPVEVKIHARLERCPGPLALGDLVYSTTLLPGEKVRLFSSDRRSRFTFDSSTKVSYRHEQLSTERYYMASMHDFMSTSPCGIRHMRAARARGLGPSTPTPLTAVSVLRAAARSACHECVRCLWPPVVD